MIDNAKGMVFCDDMISTAMASFGVNCLNLHSHLSFSLSLEHAASTCEEHRRIPSLVYLYGTGRTISIKDLLWTHTVNVTLSYIYKVVQ